MISGEYGYEDSVDTFHPPAAVTDAEAAEARGALVDYERYLAPTPHHRVLGRVTVALAHWYVPDMPGAVFKGVMGDWATDLAEFPEWAIEEAFAYWRRAEHKKPQISDIRARCQRAVRKADDERWRLKVIIKVNEQPKAPTRTEAVIRSAVRPMPGSVPQEARAKPPQKTEGASAMVSPATPEQIDEWTKAMSA